GFATGWWYMRGRRLGVVLVFGGIAVASLAGYAFAEARAEYDRLYPLVIVVDEGTPLHRGNGPNYAVDPDVPNLPAGLEARLLHRRGGWLQIRLAGGAAGWVDGARALVVAPWATEDASARRA